MNYFIAFPIDGVHCRCWCPFCRCWHIHGWSADMHRRWSHRAAHCHNPDSAVIETGYWIKLAPRTLRRSLAVVP